MTLRILLLIVISYLMGNANGAVMISRGLDKDDVRNHGSGNAGMTNYFRNFGGSKTFLVIGVDFGKAFFAALLGKLLLAPYGFALEGSVLGGLCAVLGHDFPALMHFKGGKGIMSSFGASFAISLTVSALLGAVFLLFYCTTFYVSLGSVMAAASLFVAAPFLFAGHPYAAAGLMFMAALTIFLHRENILRLLKKQERKTNFFKKEKKG